MGVGHDDGVVLEKVLNQRCLYLGEVGIVLKMFYMSHRTCSSAFPKKDQRLRIVLLL